MSARRHYTQAEADTVARLYPDFSAGHIARLLGRQPGSVYAKAAAMKIRKSPQWLASLKSGRIQRGQKSEAMKSTQFKPGMTPWNKGVPFNPGGRSAQTQFAPGNRPHTWRPVGSYRIVHDTQSGARHVEQKLNETAGPNNRRWKPVSRIVWEQAHGAVPAGHLVVFKPGMATLDPAAITPDRVECISRAENAQRNHPARHHPELAKLYQLKGAISRQVNKRIRQQQEAKTP